MVARLICGALLLAVCWIRRTVRVPDWFTDEQERMMAAKFELYEGSNGQFRWRLKSGNGQIIATSGESYTTKSSASNGIAAVQRDAVDAETEDLT